MRYKWSSTTSTQSRSNYSMSLATKMPTNSNGLSQPQNSSMSIVTNEQPINTTLIKPPDPHHPMLPASYPHLQIIQGTIIWQLQSNPHNAATQDDYHKYLCNKFNWNPKDPDLIQWQTCHLAHNWLKKTDRKTIVKYNHNWLPLQTSHHVHSTSEQQYCPSCLGQPETTGHFLQCPQPNQTQHWVTYHELIQKHCTCNPISHELNELLLAGIHCSQFNNAMIPLHISQNPQLAPIIIK